MSRKSVKNSIDHYQRARLCFVQTMSAFADKPSTIHFLKDLNVVDLIVPLLADKVPSIQHAALATLGKLMCAKHVDIRQEVLERNLVALVLKDLTKQNKHYKKTALHMLTCVAQQDERCAGLIEDKDLDSIISSLHDFDPDTRANAALALGGLAKDNKHFAERIVQCGALPPLVQILASPQLSLKHAAAFALDGIVKHSPELAESASDCDVIPLLIKALNNDEVNVKADAFLCLADIAKDSPSLASTIADGATTLAVEHLTYPHGLVQKNAATLLRDMCKHNLRLANLVVLAGGLDGLLRLIDCNGGYNSLPAIMALGYMSAQSEQIAEQIIELQGVGSLQTILQCPHKEQLQVAAAWTLGQIGKHSVDNVTALCEENVLSTLLSKITQTCVSDNLKSKCKNALNILIPKCENPKELEQMLLGNVSEELLASILCAFAKILPCDPVARRSFVTSHCLRKVQEIEPTPEIAPHLKTINACFPNEVIHFVSPHYLEDLINRLDQFNPQKSSNLPDCKDSGSGNPSGSAQSLQRSEASTTSTASIY